jgi:hypothetical protein
MVYSVGSTNAVGSVLMTRSRPRGISRRCFSPRNSLLANTTTLATRSAQAAVQLTQPNAAVRTPTSFRQHAEVGENVRQVERGERYTRGCYGAEDQQSESHPKPVAINAAVTSSRTPGAGGVVLDDVSGHTRVTVGRSARETAAPASAPTEVVTIAYSDRLVVRVAPRFSSTPGLPRVSLSVPARTRLLTHSSEVGVESSFRLSGKCFHTLQSVGGRRVSVVI